MCAQRRTPQGDGSVQRGGQGAGGRNVERTAAAASRRERMERISASRPALADDKASRSAMTRKKQRADGRRPAARCWPTQPVWRRWHPHEVTAHRRQAAQHKCHARNLKHVKPLTRFDSGSNNYTIPERVLKATPSNQNPT
jgi:hypothetical protein